MAAWLQAKVREYDRGLRLRLNNGSVCDTQHMSPIALMTARP